MILLKPSSGPLGDSFADHAARRPGYNFCGQDIGRSYDHDTADRVIRASHDGTAQVRYNADYGNFIDLHASEQLARSWGLESIFTRYGHFARIDVSDAQQVPAAMPLGEMGQSGNAAGIHLHQELWVNGKQVDPAPYYVNDLPKLRRKRHTMSTLFYLGQKDGSFTYALAGDYPGGGAANWQEFQYMPGDDSVLGKVDDERIAALVDQHGQPVGLDLGLWQDKRELYTAPLGVPSATVDPVVIANAIVDEQAARLKPRR